MSRPGATPLFQSTQPKRAATHHTAAASKIKLLFQSTQPKRAATDTNQQFFARDKKFQSTQPKRAATERKHGHWNNGYISIHAAQEGCDKYFCKGNVLDVDFNPRSPRGLRPINGMAAVGAGKFQSTQPKRAATCVLSATETGVFDFNPRSPRGLRL